MRPARERLPVLFLLISLAPLVPAGAAERPPGMQLGPFFLKPRLVLNSGVDSNVYNAESGAVRDNVTVLTPSLDVVVPVGERLRLSGTGGLGLDYFHSEESERSTNLFGSFRAEIKVSRLTLFGGGGGGRYKQRITNETDERISYSSNNVFGGMTLQVGRKAFFTTEGRRSVAVHQAGTTVDGYDVKGALDRRTMNLSAIARYALTDQTSLVGRATGTDDVFLEEHDEEKSRARSYRYLGGFEFGLRAFINGRVQAGLVHYPQNQAVPAYKGLLLETGASIPFFRFGRIGVSAGRDVNYAVARAAATDGSLRNSYVIQRLGADLSLELPLSLLLRGSASIEKDSYLLPYPSKNESVDREDRVRTYGGALLRAFGKAVRAGVSAQQWHRTSNIPGFEYRGWRYGLTAEVAP